jgi:hypothetical protein
MKRDGKLAVPLLRLLVPVLSSLFPVLLRRRREAFFALFGYGLMQSFPRRIVRAKVLQNVVDGIFESPARLVRGLHAFRDQLADFKAVDSVRKRAVNLT